jgi:hypothetical protein
MTHMRRHSTCTSEVSNERVTQVTPLHNRGPTHDPAFRVLSQINLQIEFKNSHLYVLKSKQVLVSYSGGNSIAMILMISIKFGDFSDT